MEHVFSTLIFPATEPSRHVMAQLLIFFDALSFYLPAEPEDPNNRDSNFLSDLCTPYVPAPLGFDLSRFNRLLFDLEKSRPEEFSRLFSAAKAPGAAGQARDQDEISAGSVYAALQKDADSKSATRYKERLWGARLILKLAEMLDRREAEVRQALAQVSSVEQKVFAALEGPDGTEADESTALEAPDKFQQAADDDIPPDEPAPGTSGKLVSTRLKAWAELYLADPSDPLPLALVASNRESGGILLDGFENTWQKDQTKLFSLSIPAVIQRASAQYLPARNSAREAARDNLAYLAGFIRKTAAAAGSLPEAREEIPRLADNISAWEEKVKAHFPVSGAGCKKLDFYCFPGISHAELFQRIFHLQGPFPAHKRGYPTGVLAILNS